MVQLLCKRNSLNINDSEISRSLTISDLAKLYPESVQVSRGANKVQVTWFHKVITLVFAQWLTPEFWMWCNDRTEELMSYGITATPQTIEDMLDNPDFEIEALTKLKEERQLKEESMTKITRIKPKLQAAERIMRRAYQFIFGVPLCIQCF